MDNLFVTNGLCFCQEEHMCAACRFCMQHNTPDGRKALCETITRFLVFQPIYQRAVAQAVGKIFPGRRVYDDEKDLCRLLFEAVLFEDTDTGTTPFSSFVEHAPLSRDEKRLYEAWREHTRYGFLVVEKVIPGKELHVTDLPGKNRYLVYENHWTTSIQEGMIIAARLCPFLKGWMITTEVVVSFSGSAGCEKVKSFYGEPISQFTFVQKYHTERKRRKA